MEDQQLISGWKPDRDEIIAALSDYLDSFEQRSASDRFTMPTGFQCTKGHLPPGEDRIWIKFNLDVPRMRLQAKTQAWAHECIAKDENANARFHVPAVYDFFDTRINKLKYGLIVMEFAKGISVDDIESTILKSSDMSQEEKQNKICLYKDRIIEAVCLLYSLTPPEDAAPGPYGGGIATNLVWGREEPESPRKYGSVEDLQDWINSENERHNTNDIQTDPGYPPIDLVSEDLRLCYGDMNLENFIMEGGEDLSSRLIIIDFEHANFLPTSFLIYSSWLTNDAYISRGIRLGAKLEVNEDTVQALHNIRIHRGL
ncbi:hypothetical protein KVR01_004024 [Diaporthe batatas]|uniref:uncharacterized protein n=1 Tax=Diaporthe batatas TaxID=748121 RepID=UPI001D03B6A6|nr:uncharacterized protein KVR01_004024 [Diaporthe batatas]KAG8165472.1 hypothetical protein KVR01_004024 [Diaporthe batatas]